MNTFYFSQLKITLNFKVFLLEFHLVVYYIIFRSNNT